MNYATGCALSSRELMLNFPAKTISKKHRKSYKKYGDSYSEIAARIFVDHVGMVLDDMIENNERFKLPVGNSELYIKLIDGDEFVKCRQNGKFENIDFLKSNFSGYNMVFKYKAGRVFKEKWVYIDRKRRDKLAEYTNKGKSYY